MPILILIDVQYLQNVVFSIEKKFEWSKSLLIRFSPPDKKYHQQNFQFPHWNSSLPLNAIEKIVLSGGCLTHPMLITAVYQFST